jgi:hypothetical protein
VVSNTRDSDLQDWTAAYETVGRCLALGLSVQPPKLPRSPALRRALEVEALTNRRIATALAAAKASEPGRRRRIYRDAPITIY